MIMMANPSRRMKRIVFRHDCCILIWQCEVVGKTMQNVTGSHDPTTLAAIHRKS
jgi:hypothetical protein